MRPMVHAEISSRDQNNIVRDYCESHNLVFSIPIPEFVYPNCFVQLFNILNSESSKDALILFSKLQLFDYYS